MSSWPHIASSPPAPKRDEGRSLLHRTLMIGLAVAAVGALGATLDAQRPRQAQIQRPNQARGLDTGGRARLEGELRRGFARMARQRVGLSDDQMRRLVPVTQRYERQRRGLQVQERTARLELRRLMQNEQTADPNRIDQLLTQLIDVQKLRVQSVEAEQRELSTIMTPIQRVKFMALQEQLRRRLEQFRQGRNPDMEGDTPAGPPAQRPPPG